MEQIGRYRIDGVLGAGAMGTVYKAFDPRLERTVALKTIRKDLLSTKLDDEVRSRFRTEARAAARLVHPNIVTVYDFDEDEGQAYIAMEFVEGHGLDKFTQGGRPAALDSTLYWMNQLLDALHYAHAQGIAHRDIKPANLLITPRNQLKVADFGIAKIFAVDAAPSEYLAGTPEYMSPEQFMGTPIDGRSDIFSCGVVLYQLLTGMKPFVGAMAVVMQKILQEEPPPPSTFNGALGKAFDGVIAQALRKDPAARYPAARDFAAALIEAYGHSTAAGSGKSSLSPVAAADAGNETILVAPGYMPGQPRGVPAAAGVGAPAGGSSVAPAGGSSVAPAGATATLRVPAGLSAERLLRLEALLARAVGPMAKILLRKECAVADSEPALVQALLRHIPSDSGRSEFLAAAEAPGGAAGAAGAATASGGGTADAHARPALPATVPQGGSSAAPAHAAIDEALVKAAERALLRCVGPLATILVKRTLRTATDGRALCQQLAAHIPDAAARSRFLRELGME